MTAPVIVLFRRNLRLSDHSAFLKAAETRQPVLPVYIFDEKSERTLGGASRWWLHHSLAALNETLGGHLVIRKGSTEKILKEIADDVGATAVLTDDQSSLLFQPEKIKTGSGGPYKVFTPFWRACRALPEPDAPVKTPTNITYHPYKSIALNDLGLLPHNPNWAKGFHAYWQPGEKGAQKALQHFLKNGLHKYKDGRNFPSDQEATSRLSPHLHFGEISPRQIWYAAKHFAEVNSGRIKQENIQHFFSELGWREFSHYLLHHWPDLGQKNWKKEFDQFPWQKNQKHLRAWQKGMTGYPIVDAGMRQLWQTGWMHNRVRMIAASFLIKHLMTDWRVGEEWFWDTLVDADEANNASGWQWVAGSGADASPFFRIFNPVLQGQKFDPDGVYVRQWVPELKDMPDKFIHCPWEASPMELKAAGVTLGNSYPAPIVNHDTARKQALDAYKEIKSLD